MTTNKSNNADIKPIRIVESAKPMLIAGLSREYIFGEGPMNAPAQWQEFGAYLGKIPGQKENIAYGLCFDLDNGKGIEYICGVEVFDTPEVSELPENFVQKELSSYTYAVFAHEGHVSSIRQTCDDIWKEWIPESGFKKPETADFFFERYGKEFNPRTGTGDIEVWIPVEA